MTVLKFIHQERQGIEADEIEYKASRSGVNINKNIMTLKLDKVYVLAKIMDVCITDLVEKIIQTELA